MPLARPCPEAARRRRAVAQARAAVLAAGLSSVATCAVPFGFEAKGGPPGAHWTARPVGACKFLNLWLVEGELTFVFEEGPGLEGPGH